MPLFGILIDMPTATDTLNQMGAYSKPYFNEFLPIILPLLGILIVWGAIKWLMSK